MTENKDLLPEVMRPTREAVAQVHRLLQDPQPGIRAWLMMTCDAVRDLYKALDEAGAGTDG